MMGATILLYIVGSAGFAVAVVFAAMLLIMILKPITGDPGAPVLVGLLISMTTGIACCTGATAIDDLKHQLVDANGRAGCSPMLTEGAP